MNTPRWMQTLPGRLSARGGGTAKQINAESQMLFIPGRASPDTQLHPNPGETARDREERAWRESVCVHNLGRCRDRPRPPSSSLLPPGSLWAQLELSSCVCRCGHCPLLSLYCSNFCFIPGLLITFPQSPFCPPGTELLWIHAPHQIM